MGWAAGPGMKVRSVDGLKLDHCFISLASGAGDSYEPAVA